MTSSSDILRDLERLRTLRDAGLLTNQEFERERAKIVGGTPSAPPERVEIERSAAGPVRDAPGTTDEPPSATDAAASPQLPNEEDSPPTRTRSRKRRRWWAKLGAGVALAAVVGGAATFLLSSRHPAPSHRICGLGALAADGLVRCPSPTGEYVSGSLSVYLTSLRAKGVSCQGAERIALRIAACTPSGCRPLSGFTCPDNGEAFARCYNSAGGTINFEAEYGSRSQSKGLDPRQQAVKTVAQEGFRPLSIDGFGSGSPLSVIIGQATEAADAAEQAFLFHGNRYLGTVTKNAGPNLSFDYSTGSTVALNYGLYRPSDPQCCPSAGTTAIRFHWTGNEVVALDPIPTGTSNPSVR